MVGREGDISSVAYGIEEERRPESQAIEPFNGGVEHLLAELDRLRLLLHREVLRLRAASLLTEDQFRGLYVSDEQVDAILRERYSPPAQQNGASETQPGIMELRHQIRAGNERIVARVRASLLNRITLPLLQLAEMFSLSTAERDALLVCVAPEIDLHFQILYSYAQNDVTRKRPSPDLILRLLGNTAEERLGHRSMFSPDRTLFSAPLVRFTEDALDRDSALPARSLKAEDRIVDFLLGRPVVDHRLRSFTTKVNPVRGLSDLHLPSRLSNELENAVHTFSSESAVLFFQGPKGAGKRAAAAALAAELGRPLLIADLGQAIATDLPLATALSLLCREAILQQANLHLAQAESLLTDEPEHQRRRTALALNLVPHGSLITVSTESPWTAPASFHCPCLTFDFPVPDFAQRVRLWQELIEQTGCSRSSEVDTTELASKFALTGGEILAACREAKDRAALRGAKCAAVTMLDFEAAARSQSNQGLRRLAQKVTPVCDWTDLILPPRAMQQLQEVCAAEKYRHVVYTQWGFDRRLALGKGINVLFCGPSGTGKTMAASILAQELGLDLYKIDLSTVVSKYIGETEKQLSQIFREAQSSNAVLFFDEADALFGKRSEVKDAHDRYANVEVAYLLQKMEEYEGIVILATNFRKNMDDAFTRRMHHIIEFLFPDAEYRERIWRRLMPPDAPVAQDVDFGFLARQFELSGGHIRNVAVAAAFLAAESGSPIRMEHFILATARELQKLGRLASRADFREYYELTRSRG